MTIIAIFAATDLSAAENLAVVEVDLTEVSLNCFNVMSPFFRDSADLITDLSTSPKALAKFSMFLIFFAPTFSKLETKRSVSCATFVMVLELSIEAILSNIVVLFPFSS